MKTLLKKLALFCLFLAALMFAAACDQPAGTDEDAYQDEIIYSFTGITEMAEFLTSMPQNDAETSYNVMLTGYNGRAAAAQQEYDLNEIFAALSGRYVNLDISLLEWTNIDGALSSDLEARLYKDKLTSITLPLYAETIGNFAFWGTSSLRSCYLPEETLEIIGISAFGDCAALESIDITAQEVGESAFSGCTSLKQITLRAGVENIGAYAFFDCLSLESCTLEAVTPPNLGNYAFMSTPESLVFYVPNAQAISIYTVRPDWGVYANQIFMLDMGGGLIEIYFDDGKRRAAYDTDYYDPNKDTTSETIYRNHFTVVSGKKLALSPISWGIGSGAAYEWLVDGTVQEGVTGEIFTFSPSEVKSYSVECKVVDGDKSAETNITVQCVAAPVKRTKDVPKRTAASVAFTPAPGQFTGVCPPVNLSTEKDVNNDCNAKLEGTKTLTYKYWDGWSLGDVGGYFTTMFDHSVSKMAGGNEIIIKGNAFSGWYEPGVVWVSRDDNGDEIQNDTWYELKGSEYGSSETIQRYAITYYRPVSGSNVVKWTDNQGKSGETAGPYPVSVKGAYVTFTGTKLGSSNVTSSSSGYVDTSTTKFSIANAVQVDGSPADLDFIDFVKVQCAVSGTAFGGLSTEMMVPMDAGLPPDNELSGAAVASGTIYVYTFINNSGYDITISYRTAQNGEDKSLTILIGKTAKLELSAIPKIWWDISSGNANAKKTHGTIVFDNTGGDL
ncbi:MAG: leucine-rich repeat domain-containing protein [Treponema sp.]|jgi:hypothetical protein|nr:leucine-rich repeat domain-containing protein [Treponema sp.]